MSGLNSPPVGPERKRSHTPASRSICTLRGTYLGTGELTSEKYVSTCQKIINDFFPVRLERKKMQGWEEKRAYARELQWVGAVVRLLCRISKRDRKERQRRTPVWSSPCSARTIFQKFSPIWFPAWIIRVPPVELPFRSRRKRSSVLTWPTWYRTQKERIGSVNSSTL